MDEILERIKRLLKVEFKKKQFKLGKFGKWGKVDRCAMVNSNKLVFLEVEIGQSHPDHNVLKVWPYLRENRRVQVFLIQVISSKCLSKYRARVLLSEWIGRELEKRFRKRFHYCKIVVSNRRMRVTKKIETEFNEFCLDN